VEKKGYGGLDEDRKKVLNVKRGCEGGTAHGGLGKKIPLPLKLENLI